MKLKECTTCGSHSFTGNKCDYCGNVYEVEIVSNYNYKSSNEIPERPTQLPDTEKLDGLDLDFSEEHINNKGIKFMLGLLVAIIWFAITVFLPPLFLITICCLIIWGCKWLIKKGEKK